MSNFYQYDIAGESMEPSLHGGEKVLVSKNDKNYKKSDIIIFNCEYFGNITMIKRITAVQGDTITLSNDKLIINGVKTHYSPIENGINYPYTVPQNTIFVLGDNYNNSQDSRLFGGINKKDIIGLVKYRYYPITKIGEL